LLLKGLDPVKKKLPSRGSVFVNVITIGRKAFKIRRVRAAHLDSNQLQVLVAATVQMLENPLAQAREPSKAIPKAAGQPESGGQGPPGRASMRRLVHFPN
jgi:hypothetical protein